MRRPSKALTRRYLSLNPTQLKRELGSCHDRLLKIAAGKPPKTKKKVNRPHGPALKGALSKRGLTLEDIFVMQPRGATRTS